MIIDPRISLYNCLIKQGCNSSLANLISVEAGGSQAFVDYNYLTELGMQRRLIKKYLQCVSDFYFSMPKENKR